MLQIITGKFFVTNDLHVTRQRGVLYTNYWRFMQEPITTSVGTLLPVSTRGDISSFIYEVDERLEAVDRSGRREILISVRIDAFIEDFAAVTAFDLNITCTPNIDLARRLTQAIQPALGVPKLPCEYVRRVFDKEVNWAETDAAHLKAFIDNLVGLERKNYKSVMRAIRRYVHGLHRIADDLDLAFALLVAAIESLAQDFDDFEPVWEDYAQHKRQEFDKVLATAPPEITEDIHKTILKHEHVALSRRFREFVLKNLQPSFFREEAQAEFASIRRCDLPEALDTAYKTRSSYVHTLREMPRIITAVPTLADVMMVQGKPVLSIQGLARIARHVIHNIVAHYPKVDHEDFDYRSDLPNTIQAQLAEHYWIHREEGYNRETAREYLNGFLNQLASIWAGDPNAKMTDIRAVIAKIEMLVPGLAKPEQRLPLLTLYLLFNCFVRPEDRRAEWEKFFDKYAKDFDAPSSESLLAHVLTGNVPDWTLEQCEEAYKKYFKQRFSKNHLQYGPFFDAIITLWLAEMYRQSGDEARAKALIGESVENFPKYQQLLDFEATLSTPLQKIDWQKLLLRSTIPEANTIVVETDHENDATRELAQEKIESPKVFLGNL